MTPCKHCGYKTPKQNELCEHCRTEGKHLMKYEFIPGKEITMQEVVHSGASAEEVDKFIRHHIKNYHWSSAISINQDLLDYCSKDCFVNWLIKIGKLKIVEKFEPFTIEIPINSVEEYWEVWHRMNAYYVNFESYRKNMKENDGGLVGINFNDKNSHKLWKYVDKYIMEGPWKKQL